MEARDPHDVDFLVSLTTARSREQSTPRIFPSLLPTSSPRDGISAVSAHGGLIKTSPAQAGPKRFSYLSSAGDSPIYATDFYSLFDPDEDVGQLFNPPEERGSGFWWINVDDATSDEVQAVCKAYGIHPLTMEDIGSHGTREKFELFPSYYFACFKSLRRQDDASTIDHAPFNVYVVVLRQGTISFSFTPNAHASKVQSRVAMLREHVSLSSDWICYALM